MINHFLEQLEKITQEKLTYNLSTQEILNAEEKAIYEFLPNQKMIRFCGAWIHPNEQWRYIYVGIGYTQNFELKFHPEVLISILGLSVNEYDAASELRKETLMEYAEQLNEFLQIIKSSFTYVMYAGKNWFYIFEEDFQIRVQWELSKNGLYIKVSSVHTELNEVKPFYNGDAITKASTFIKEYIDKLTLILTFSTYTRVYSKYPKLHRVMFTRFDIPIGEMEACLNAMSSNLSMSLIEMESLLFARESELYKRIEISLKPIAGEGVFCYSFASENNVTEEIYYRRKPREQIV
ncbi:hypothetical protein [Bacillus toyonensis]|uniref:hypothetical protein n=1 Tax=Bacillus toyonensis TaxID=155322 RepID=UPI002E229A3C|nr:hypothetical protein [Bacillus toyonensis]